MNARNDLLRRKIMGYLVSQAIMAVTQLDVADHLAAGPVSADQLAARVGADPGALYRFLRVLAAEGLFVENADGTFALTELGSLLRSDIPGSLRHFVTLMGGEAYLAWSAAAHSLRTGQPAFEAVHGKPMFEWLRDNPAASATFNEAQAGLVTLRLLPLVDRPWSGVGTVVDVGGGHGTLLVTLLSRHLHLHAVLFDLPHVAAEAQRMLDSSPVLDRCRIVPGDFFTAVPPGGDVYVLAQILHDWQDAEATAILRQCRAAMAPHARLLILEQVVRDDGEPSAAKLLDLHMLILLGGQERTESRWYRLLRGAGFAIAEIQHGPRSSLIEARPITTTEVPEPHRTRRSHARTA